jgi:hypothetical protein
VPAMGLTIGSDFLFSADTLDIAACTWRGLASTGDSIRCITVVGPGELAETYIVGVRFAQSATHYADSGGAILVHGQHVEVRNCIFDSCSAGYGGGIAAIDAQLSVRNCRFNSCGEFRSAAISQIVLGNAIFDSCIFQNSLSYENIDEQPLQFQVSTGNLEIRNSLLTNLWHNHYPAGTSIVGARNPPDSVMIVGCEILRNRMANLVSYNEQVDYLCIDSNVFSDNELALVLYQQDVFDSLTYFQAIGNVFERFRPVPGYVLDGPFAVDTSYQNVTILERNLVQEMDSGNVAFCSVFYDHPNLRRIKHNYVVNNANWSWLWPPSGMVLAVGVGDGELEENIFMGNRGYAIFQGPVIGFPVVYARHNYFGHFTGPYDSLGNPGGQGDTIEWRIIYQPWATDTSFMSAVPDPQEHVAIPNSFIGNAYPNPFNSSVTIEFVLLNDQEINLDVYDLTGRFVASVLSGRMNKGVHIREWSPQTQASGIYFARLQTAEGVYSTAKLMYLK